MAARTPSGIKRTVVLTEENDAMVRARQAERIVLGEDATYSGALNELLEDYQAVLLELSGQGLR